MTNVFLLLLTGAALLSGCSSTSPNNKEPSNVRAGCRGTNCEPSACSCDVTSACETGCACDVDCESGSEVCFDACGPNNEWVADGECDDTGPNGGGFCDYGTDCSDCGPRATSTCSCDADLSCTEGCACDVDCDDGCVLPPDSVATAHGVTTIYSEDPLNEFDDASNHNVYFKLLVAYQSVVGGGNYIAPNTITDQCEVLTPAPPSGCSPTFFRIEQALSGRLGIELQTKDSLAAPTCNDWLPNLAASGSFTVRCSAQPGDTVSHSTECTRTGTFRSEITDSWSFEVSRP